MIHRFLLLVVMALGVAGSLAAAERPNFIFVITDDISAEDIGPYGHKVVKTPNLDRMAREGRVFDQAYLTTSSCSPSRCSIITGRYPHNHGAPELHLPLPRDQRTFIQDLQAAGYYTLIAGKNHIGEANEIGFERAANGGKPGGNEEWVKLLRDRPAGRPFFAWLASSDAHRAWQRSDRAPTYKPEDVVVPPYLVDGPETRADLAQYYHEVSRSDTALGELFAELERQGIAASTYVIYCSDNGRPFPRCKTRLYDSGIKTPLLVWRPGTIQPGRTNALVSAVDFSATFLDLAGVKAGPTFQGVSFAPVLRDPRATVRDYAFAEHNWHVYGAHERMVREGDWLYIRNARPNQQNLSVESDDTFPAGKELWAAQAAGTTNANQRDVFLNPRPREELYDVRRDPHQLKNLAADASAQDALRQLGGVLDRWVRETGDTIPAKPTPDRAKGRTNTAGELPGAATMATRINQPGPVRK